MRDSCTPTACHTTWLAASHGRSAISKDAAHCYRCSEVDAELSMGWVDPWVGLGRDFAVFGGVGWVGSTIAKVLKI